MAAMTLIHTAGQRAVCCVGALGADKAARPAYREQGFVTLGFCAVTIEEFGQGQAGLELYWITCHDLLPPIHSISYYFIRIAEIKLWLVGNQVKCYPGRLVEPEKLPVVSELSWFKTQEYLKWSVTIL